MHRSTVSATTLLMRPAIWSVMSRRANQAKGAHGFADAMQFVRQLEDRPLLEIGGLGAAAWRRIAVLCSFVEALPHADACTLPLLVLPPRRLHMFNPVQSLQTVISCQLLRPGWARRSRSFEDMLKGKPLRRAYQAFFHAFLPRVLEAVPPAVRQARDEHDQQKIRWAIEDAWSTPLVLRRWTDFARLLDAPGCERLLELIGEPEPRPGPPSGIQRCPGDRRLESAVTGLCAARRADAPHAVAPAFGVGHADQPAAVMASNQRGRLQPRPTIRSRSASQRTGASAAAGCKLIAVARRCSADRLR